MPKAMAKSTANSRFKLDSYTRNLFVIFDQTRDTLIRAVELELRQSKTNFAQARVLYVLTQKKNGMTQGDLSKWLLRNLNTVSTLITKMEKEGLVKKAKNKEDGKVYVTLTQKGCEEWDEVSDRAIFFDLLSSFRKRKETVASASKEVAG
jgi:DNA-binding MarR family transcriptional regulator